MNLFLMKEFMDNKRKNYIKIKKIQTYLNKLVNYKMIKFIKIKDKLSNLMKFYNEKSKENF